MSDPYKTGMFQQNPYYAKRTVEGRLVVVLDGKYEQRGLQLIPQVSRALLQHEIHELIVSDEEGIGPGSAWIKLRTSASRKLKRAASSSRGTRCALATCS